MAQKGETKPPTWLIFRSPEHKRAAGSIPLFLCQGNTVTP
jgi:hypothetical protein